MTPYDLGSRRERLKVAIAGLNGWDYVLYGNDNAMEALLDVIENVLKAENRPVGTT